MSQHNFVTTHDTRPVNVILGWDRPLGQYFLVIERLDATDDDSDDILYSNLNERDPFSKDLSFFKKKLEELTIQAPDRMFVEVEHDRRVNAGNRYVWHEIDGSMKEG